MLLTVVTVVYNDGDALRRTLLSVEPHLEFVEHIVIDKSETDVAHSVFQVTADPRVEMLVRPALPLFEAFNLGLSRATGEYVLFLNAGDTFYPSFEPRTFLLGQGKPGRVLIGYAVERHGDAHFLRPGRGKEHRALLFPSHPATAYPRAAYRQLEFNTELSLVADGHYTRQAIDLVGCSFVREVVAEFELGGRSSSYGDVNVVKTRLKESDNYRQTVKLLTKFVLWRLLPARQFYRMLAWGKYERMDPSDLPQGVDRRGEAMVLALGEAEAAGIVVRGD
jgi:putative colanic acid biosynthesis glycosyltransferase